MSNNSGYPGNSTPAGLLTRASKCIGKAQPFGLPREDLPLIDDAIKYLRQYRDLVEPGTACDHVRELDAADPDPACIGEDTPCDYCDHAKNVRQLAKISIA
jgi:hypothetical protein